MYLARKLNSKVHHQPDQEDSGRKGRSHSADYNLVTSWQV